MFHIISEKSLKNNLKLNFESHIFSRGVGYYHSGNVLSLKVFPSEIDSEIEIRSEVAGSDDYSTSLFFDFKKNSFRKMDCDCPYGDACKHIAAVGLEFIDFYIEFMDNSVLRRATIRNDLIHWINSQVKAENYGGDKVLRKVKFDDDIVEGEFEEIDDYRQNRTKEELLDEFKSMLDIGDAPDGVVDGLIKALAAKGVDVRNGLETSQCSPIKKKRFNPDSYYVILEDGYGKNTLSDIRVKKNSGSETDPSVMLRQYDLDGPHKELFKFLRKLSFVYHGDIDYKKLFNILRNSKLKIYWNRHTADNLLTFSPVADDNKIKILLKLEDVKYEFNERLKKEFVFELDDKYKKVDPLVFLFYSDGFIKIEDKSIGFYQLTNPLVKILSRIDLIRTGYHFGNERYFKTMLEQEEILELNKIIEDCHKCFDFQTDLTQNFEIEEFTEAKPCVVVDYDSKKDLLEIQAGVDYGFKKINVGQSVNRYRNMGMDTFSRTGLDKYVIGISKKNISYGLVDEKKEIEIYKHFYFFHKDYGFKKRVECKLEGEKEIFKYFTKHWDNLEKFANKKNYKIEFIGDKFSFTVANFKADFDVDLNAENDWLGFDVSCYCGDEKIRLEDLRKYVEDKKEFIKMDDGRMLKITNLEELERFVLMLESFYAREKGGFEGKLYHAPELENVFTKSEYYNAKVQKSFNNFIKEAQNGKSVKKIKLPAKLDRIMRDYQKEGVDWLYFLRKYRFAGILADDMGLGKTLQALVLLEKEKVKGNPSIVICPKTLLYNWQNEAEKFVPKLKTIVIDGNPLEREKIIKKIKNYDLIITGYATIKKDSAIYEKQKIKFNYCVLDEAQFIKNHITKNAQVVKKVNADYRLALTGTPLENSVSEIWSIFDFLMPGFLGSYRLFAKKFEKPIMQHNNKLALDNLRKKIECFMLRRTKSEVLKELPPKVEQMSHCHLGKGQNILYQEILANVKSEIFETVKTKGFNKSRIHILAGLTKLRQVCNHPVLLLKDDDYTKYESSKLNMFLELIDEIIENKRKVLVFSQFTKMLDILGKELDKKKINYHYLSGKTRNRQELIDDFNENNNLKVFLISLKAGGTGINLTSADTVIIFDPWWNPSVENQAIDRTHRIGQKNSVNVYRLITKGTIEEKIVKLQEKKKLLFDRLVGESKDLFTKLTWDDIKGLFE